MDPDPALGDKLRGVLAGSGQTAPYQFRGEPGPASHLDLVDAGQRRGQRVVHGVEPGHVLRGRKLVEMLQAGERIVVNGLQRVRPGSLLAPTQVSMDGAAERSASAAPEEKTAQQ